MFDRLFRLFSGVPLSKERERPEGLESQRLLPAPATLDVKQPPVRRDDFTKDRAGAGRPRPEEALHLHPLDKPFELVPKKNAVLQKMTAPEVLHGVYGGLLPGTRAVVDVRPAYDGGDSASYAVSWFHGDTKVASLSRKLSLSRDGSLDLFSSNFFVHPDYRGRGLAAHVLKAQVAWLRENSAHPNTRISMGAGTAKGERVGPYVWANFGFDFVNMHADRAQMHSRTHAWLDYGARKEPKVFREAFAQWLEAKAFRGELPKDPELLNGLKEASTHWKHSWDVANFHVPGLEVEASTGTRVGKYSLGKAFLLDPKTPTWAGVFFVNEPDSEAAKIQDAYTQATLDRAAALAPLADPAPKAVDAPRVKFRYAPTPSRDLGISGAHTALINWAAAKRLGGEFSLRIEDLDPKSRPEHVRDIEKNLEWLGVHWDGKVIVQSERKDLYRAKVDALVEAGKAYRAEGGEVFLRIPKDALRGFEDKVKGPIAPEPGKDGPGDLSILGADGSINPLFARVVDDGEEGITHVIRSERHLKDALRELPVYEALGYPPPQYFHIPAVRDGEGQPLSTPVRELRAQGHQPFAVANHLVRLGLKTPPPKGKVSLDELAKQIDLDFSAESPRLGKIPKGDK